MLEAAEFLLRSENIHHMTIKSPHHLTAWGCSSRTVTIATRFNEDEKK